MKKYFRSDLDKESTLSRHTVHWRLWFAGHILAKEGLTGVKGKWGVMVDPDTGKYCVEEDEFRKYWKRLFKGGRHPKMLEAKEDF